MDEATRKPKISFGLRTLLEIVAAVAVLLALVFGGAWISPERYQIFVDPGPGSTHDQIYVIDQKTGRVWRRGSQASSTWKDFGSPVENAP